MNIKRITAIAGIVGSSLGLVLTGTLSVAATDKGTIKIVSHSPLSGPQSVDGVAVRNGVQLAVEDYGKLISSLGFNIKFEPYDDQAQPAVGTSNANRIIEDADIMAVVGHFNSGVSIPASVVYAQADLVMVSPSSVLASLTDRLLPNVNRVCGRADVAGPAIAQFAVQNLKAKRLFVLSDKTAYGEAISTQVATSLKSLGAKVIYDDGFSSDEVDFSALMNIISVERPDAIFLGASDQVAGLFLRQLRERRLSTALLGGDSFDSSNLQLIAGASNVSRVYFTTMGAPISELPSAKPFQSKYKVKFGINPEGYSSYSYDAAHAVIEGIAAAIKTAKGRPSRAQVSKAVRAVRFAGLTGQIAFNARGDLPTATYFVIDAQPTYAQNKVLNRIVRNAASTR
jgi:branched-chain amino acid transport system substrate-binding protein